LILSLPFYPNLPHHGKALNSLICAHVPLRNCSLTLSSRPRLACQIISVRCVGRDVSVVSNVSTYHGRPAAVQLLDCRCSYMLWKKQPAVVSIIISSSSSNIVGLMSYVMSDVIVAVTVARHHCSANHFSASRVSVYEPLFFSVSAAKNSDWGFKHNGGKQTRGPWSCLSSIRLQL